MQKKSFTPALCTLLALCVFLSGEFANARTSALNPWLGYIAASHTTNNGTLRFEHFNIVTISDDKLVITLTADFHRRGLRISFNEDASGFFQEATRGQITEIQIHDNWWSLPSRVLVAQDNLNIDDNQQAILTHRCGGTLSAPLNFVSYYHNNPLPCNDE